MKRKFTLLFLCFLMAFTFILTGCDLFPRNYKEYLNKSVATLTYDDGKVYDITTEEFIQAFNSYGSSLVSNGTEYAEATEKTMDVLVNRHILLQHAKKQITLNEDDKKEVLDDVYNSLVSYLDSYIKVIREEWDITDATANEEESTSKIVYTAFSQKAEVVDDNGTLKIKLLDTNEDKQTTNFSSIDDVISTFKSYANPTDNTNHSKIYKEAYRRFISALKTNEQNLGKSTDTDSVFKRHVEKTYTSNEENLYITKLEDYYVTDDGFSTISVKQVLDKYKALLVQSKFKYENDNTAFDSAMLESYNATNYVVNDKYFNVSHILIKFDETVKNEDGLTQKEQYDALSKEKAYMTEGQYQIKLNELIGGIKANVRNTTSGEITATRAISAQNILSNLKAELNSASSDAQKDEIFKKYIYSYNEDDGVMNAEYTYVVGTETSKMVESFTDDARELNTNGVYGAISEQLVVSEFGVHILYYAGKCDNLFEITNYSTFKLEESDINTLSNTKLSPFNNKTLFDLLFTDLSNDSYSVFENMNLNILKQKVKINKHSNVYKNL